MSKIVASLLFSLGLISQCCNACDIRTSQEYQFLGGEGSPPTLVGAKQIDLVKRMSGGEICVGVGFISIYLTGSHRREMRDAGFFIRPISGVSENYVFPSFPLAPVASSKGRVLLEWAWFGIPESAQSDEPWVLEITPVSRSGIRGKPLLVCTTEQGVCGGSTWGRDEPNYSLKRTTQSLRD